MTQPCPENVPGANTMKGREEENDLVFYINYIEI